MTPARLRWGLLLIQIGALVLLVNIDVINYNFVFELLWAFPFFLIAIGVEKIFTRSRLEFISYLAVAFIFFGGLYFAIQSSYGNSGGDFFESTTYRQELETGVADLKAVVRLGEGQLEIRDATDDLIYGRFASYTPKPRIKYVNRDGSADITIACRTGGLARGLIHVGEEEDWTLKFSRSVPLTMECYGDKADLDLNLATTPLRSLKIDANKATVRLRLGRLQPNVDVDILGKGTELRLRLPRDVGTGIRSERFASVLRRAGMTEQDGVFLSPGYDTLETKIAVELDSDLASCDIRFYD